MESGPRLLQARYLLPEPGNSTTLSPGGLVINQNEIAAVGKPKELANNYPDSKTLNLGNQLLMPGLVNTHTHLGMTYLRGLADDLSLDRWLDETYQYRSEHLTDQDQIDAFRLGLAECLLHGITTVADMSFYQHRYLEPTIRSGIRAVLFDTTMKEYLDSERQNEILSFLEQDSPDRILHGAAVHAPYSLDNRLLDWFTNHIIQTNDTAYSIHLAETRDEKSRVRKQQGKTPVQWLNDRGFFTENCLAIHGVWLTDEELDLLARHGVSLSHNPNSNAKLGAGLADLPGWLDRGISTGLGTDSAASNNRLDLFQEMDAATKYQKLTHRDPSRLPAETILKLATTGGARALNLDHRIGRLEPGYQADIISINLDSPELKPFHEAHSTLVYSALGRDVSNVWVDGKRIVKNHDLQTISPPTPKI